jgi:phosphatidate cytidylyltransferase
MFENPLASPYFLPLLALFAGLLFVTLVAILVSVRFSLARLGQSVLFERWKVWAIIALVCTFPLLSGDIPTLLLLTAMIFQGLREYTALVKLPAGYSRLLIGLGFLVVPAAFISPETFFFLPPILLIFGTLQPLFLHAESQGEGVRHLAFAALGWGYIGWLIGYLALIYKYEPQGRAILAAVIMAVALSDVGAFTVGKLFGRHKLAPRISPNKTVEGLIGNILGAYLGFGLIYFTLPFQQPLILLLALPPVIGLGAVWGDLVESAIKREFQTKDAGNWLPGFGGLLDRIDSLIIVGPLVYYFLRIIQ